jgi:hypothetical protein
MEQPHRNDPCPCGSGRKYKKCCALKAQPATPSTVSRANAFKEADRKLAERLLRYSHLRLGPDWLPKAIADYSRDAIEEIDEAEYQIAIPWAIYLYPIPDLGASVVEIYSEDETVRVPLDLREVLEAQLDACLTIWDVRSVDRGTGALMRDVLTGDERFVHEIMGTEFLKARDAVLGWVLDSGDVSIFGGMHPSGLKPSDAELIVRQIRKLCRVRTKPVSRDCLASPVVQTALLHSWRALVAARLRRSMPVLTNTDGDPLSLTVDHFEILTNDPSGVIAHVASFEGAEEPDMSARGETRIALIKPGNPRMKEWDNTIIGTVVIEGAKMRLETNSTRRADSLREGLRSHLGSMVRYRLREETDSAQLWRGDVEPRKRTEKEDREARGVERQYKERYYMTAWLDDAIPALDGLTPREAVKVPRAKKQLEILLRDFENTEAAESPESRFDVGRLRKELGLSE